MWRCAGNVSAHFTSSMASASRAQCLLFLFLSLRAAQWPHLLFVCNSHITYCMQGRIQSPLHLVDFGPQCCCCCFSSFLSWPQLWAKQRFPQLSHLQLFLVRYLEVSASWGVHALPRWGARVSFFLGCPHIRAGALQRSRAACGPGWRRQNKFASPIL